MRCWGPPKEGTLDERAVITLQDVAKSFRQGGTLHPVLSGVSLSIYPGQIAVLRGQNGSGKTTLLRVIAGLVTPDSGSVRRGRDVSRAAITFSSGEERSLWWRLSARRNLEFAGALEGLSPGSARVGACELLEALDLYGIADLPLHALSAGQKQRVLVARAFIGSPRLVLLDEPTEHMDDASTQLLWRFLRNQAGCGRAVLLTSHREEDEPRADTVLVLSEGQLCAEPSATPEPSGPPGAATVPARLGAAPFWRQWGFLRRDAAIALSYPAGLALQLLASLMAGPVAFFLGQIVGNGSAHLQAYGGRYFPFAVLGLAAFTLQLTALSAFPTSIREGQLTGTLETMLSSGASLPEVLIGSSLWNFLLSLLEVAVLLGSSAVFFGLGFRGGGLLLAAFAIILNVLVCAGLGLCEAAFVLLYKRGAPVNALVNMASQLLGGVLYPIAVLPVLLQVLAGLLPVTHTANALRLSLLTPDTSSALEELLALAILAPVYIAVGLVALSLALRLARSRGSLGQY